MQKINLQNINLQIDLQKLYIDLQIDSICNLSADQINLQIYLQKINLEIDLQKINLQIDLQKNQSAD